MALCNFLRTEPNQTMAKFVKGHSGNPGGRPKDEAEIRALAREHTKEAIDRLVEWMRSSHPKASPAASAALLDRGWGKPTTTVEAGPALAKILFAWVE